MQMFQFCPNTTHYQCGLDPTNSGNMTLTAEFFKKTLNATGNTLQYILGSP